MPEALGDLVRYLDGLLDVGAVPDSSRAFNGLQVENSGSVTRVGAAVDICKATIDLAARAGVDFLIVHHGLFFSGDTRITGAYGNRVRALIHNDIALYSSHIPLDYHPELGNNIRLANKLGIDIQDRFGDYEGVKIGYRGRLDTSRDELVSTITAELDTRPHVIAEGPERVRCVAVVTGAGGSMIREAHQAGVDTLVTGEGNHHSHFEAEELGINVIYAGHYATETLGVKALAAHVAEKLDVPWQFLDHPTGL